MQKTLILVLAATVGVIGCRSHSVISAKTRVVDAETAALRNAVPKVDHKQSRAMREATNTLSLNVLRESINENPNANLAISPMSLAQDFTLVHESSKGTTKELVAKLLNVNGLSSDALAGFHSAFLNDLDTDPYETLTMANAIWIKDRYPVDEAFAKRLNALFGCSVQPFPSDLSKAKSEMDAWVSKNTNGMIKEIKTDLGLNVFVMFLNALYFDGKWEHEFKAGNTKPEDFHAPNGAVKAQMMSADKMEISACGESSDPGVEMPFLGKRFSFVAIVPKDPAALKALVKQMSVKWFAGVLSSMYPSEVDVKMPRLDLSTVLNLEPTIAKLGGGALFSPPLDLSVLSPQQGKDKGLCFIQSVIQQVKLKLDETGVKAAAVTEIAGAVKSTEMPTRVVFDRPFLYFIIHKASGAIVLCGIVNDPTKS